MPSTRWRDRALRHGGWLVAAAYGLARWSLPPRAFNSHAIMYALVAVTRTHNALEWFHPLYPPLLVALSGLRAALGLSGEPLRALQALSLAGAMANLVLVHRLARRVSGDDRVALLAALLATASINLWAWSMQTMPYTIATALVLWIADLALASPRPGARRAALLGALTGAAACFDTTCALAAVPLAADAVALYGLGATLLPAAAFAGAFLACLALGYLPLLLKLHALGGALPHGLGEFMASLPADIVPLGQSRSLAFQWGQFRASTAPVDAPYWLMAAFLAFLSLGPGRDPRASPAFKRLIRLGSWFFAAAALFFFVSDPHNRFLYAAGLFVAPLAALALARRRDRAAWVALLWLLLIGKNAAFPADYMPARNPGFDEARFVRAALSPRDLLIAASQPDWLFSYALDGKIPAVEVAWPRDAGDPFGYQRLPPGPRLNARIRATLCAKGRALLAPDRVFRSSLITSADMDAHLTALQRSFQGSFALGAPLVSPLGQRYYPLSLRPGGGAACPGGARR